MGWLLRPNWLLHQYVMSPWRLLLCLSFWLYMFKLSHFKSFGDQPPVNSMYEGLIQKCFAETWLHSRVPGMAGYQTWQGTRHGKVPGMAGYQTWQGTTWWRHQMETFSALLAICAGNSPVTGESPARRPVTRSCDDFFNLHLNKRLSKQWWSWWFETLWGPLWRHCNE